MTKGKHSYQEDFGNLNSILETAKRQGKNALRYARELAINYASGQILTEYMHGGDGTSSSDQEYINLMLHRIVLFTKPWEEWWSQKEVAEFSERQREEILMEAQRRLQGLDPQAIQTIYDELRAQAEAGKREWTRGELEPLLQKLD